MRKVRVEDAIGMELCHDVTAITENFKGPLFRRGHIICPDDVSKLLDIGKRTIYVWEQKENEIHEEDAALRLSKLVSSEHAHFTGPSEGKMLLFADEPGMLRINKGLLHKVNSIDDITVTTLPDHYPCPKGLSLCSLRIVPLVTDKKNIEKAEELCKEEKLLKLLPYRTRRAGIIITGFEIYSGRTEDKFEKVIRKKLSEFPSEIVGVRICNDDEKMIIEAAEKLMDEGADFLIFTGGMSVDPDDITPGAIKKMGARIVSYGVPAQPGNMTLVAYIKDIPVLGVPGAAVHMPTTVLDVLLPAIFAGEEITKENLTNLEDGGLCQMCKTCHYPNCTFGKY